MFTFMGFRLQNENFDYIPSVEKTGGKSLFTKEGAILG